MRRIYTYLDSISCEDGDLSEEQTVFILRHLYVCESRSREFTDCSLMLVKFLQRILHWVLHEMSIKNLEVLATIL